MMKLIRDMLGLMALLIGCAANVDAFSHGGMNLQQTPAKIRSSTNPGGRIRSPGTQLPSSQAGVIRNDVTLISQKPLNEASTAMFGTGIFTVLSLAVVYQAMGVDAPTIHNMQDAVMKIPANIWASYSEVLAEAPIQTKAVTSAAVYTIGDLLSQKTEGVSISELDKPRVMRSLFAGLLGHGPLSHFWYQFSDNLFENVLHLHNDVFGTAVKVVIDQTTWGPVWNNTYILMLGLMKMDSFGTIWGEMKRNTVPLIVSGLKLWPLAHCVTYGLIPVENRLLWVDTVEIFWVTILASTAAGNKSAEEGKQASSL